MKKSLLMALCIALAAALSIGGTMAYLQDSDSDVNVMTLGNVDIEQLEYERVEQSDNNTSADNLKFFEKDKPLYPAVYQELAWAENYQEWSTGGSSQLFTDKVKNVVDKFVFVENVGKSDAYVRTWFAFEQGNLTENEFEDLVGQNVNSAHWTWETVASGVEINGGRYLIKLATYKGNAGEEGTTHPNGLLAPGETTRPSLLQVMLYKHAGNKDLEALDSNGDGKYNILVTSQAVQAAGFEDLNNNGTAADEALDAGFTHAEPFSDELKKDDTDLIPTPDSWESYADTSWYSDSGDEFILMTAEELAGLATLVDDGNTFEGKTVKLGRDIDLYAVDENGNSVCFEPIGSYRNDKAFKGTFDGQNHTITNLNQNTWTLNNGYYYGDLGLGLFGLVEDATIKNLTMDNASISGESAICGTVAATAYGNSTFENITVTNTEVADYQYYAGGIVGWASGDHKYINCDVAASTTIAAQWGDFDNSTGGLIGGAGGSANIYIEDCDVSCRIDAYNDVTSSYQWYAYRRCGMLIGNPGKTIIIDDTTYADAPQLTAKNCTVTYGDWANYTYCEFAGTSWPYVRVQAGVSNSAYSNPRYGHPTDANGNEVVDDNHVHNEGEEHFIKCTFDQLYGGGQGVYGRPTHDGVTIINNNK